MKSSRSSASGRRSRAGRGAVHRRARRGVWVYVVGDGLKQVKTSASDDTGMRFEQIDADGFQLFVESDLVQPETWTVVLRHLPHRHVDVLWDGGQPGPDTFPRRDLWDLGYLFRL